jgi:hypothetical protein
MHTRVLRRKRKTVAITMALLLIFLLLEIVFRFIFDTPVMLEHIIATVVIVAANFYGLFVLGFKL